MPYSRLEQADRLTYSEPDIIYESEIDDFVLRSRAILDWLEEVEIFIPKSKTKNLRKVCENIELEKASLVQVRGLESQYTEVYKLLEEQRDLFLFEDNEDEDDE